MRAADFRITRMSSVYETEPQDVRGQPWFLNMVLEAETTLFPRQLLGRIQKVEQQLGRRRPAPGASAGMTTQGSGGGAGWR